MRQPGLALNLFYPGYSISQLSGLPRGCPRFRTVPDLFLSFLHKTQPARAGLAIKKQEVKELRFANACLQTSASEHFMPIGQTKNLRVLVLVHKDLFPGLKQTDRIELDSPWWINMKSEVNENWVTTGRLVPLGFIASVVSPHLDSSQEVQGATFVPTIYIQTMKQSFAGKTWWKFSSLT